MATFGASQQHEIFWFSDYKRLPAVYCRTHTHTEKCIHMEKFMLAFKMWPARQRNYAMWLLLLLLPLALNPLAFVILFVYIEVCVCARLCVSLTYT